MKPSTPEDLAADLAVCEAATAGPWYAGGPYPSVSVIVMVDGGSWSPGECPEPPLFEPICMLHQSVDFETPSPAECVNNAELIARQRTRFPQVVRELIEERERRAETVAMCEQLRLENERWRANEAEREANRCAVTGTCHHCKTSIFRSQGLAIDGDGKEYHWTCIVTKRAELAEAEVERLRAMLKRWVSEPWGKREPSIREIIDMLRRLESDAPEWFRPQISNVLKMIIDGVAGE